MECVRQTLEDLLEGLSSLEVDWKDDMARRVIARIEHLPTQRPLAEQDIHDLFGGDFEEGKLICRLFLGLSKDAFAAILDEALGAGGQGVTRYARDPEGYVRVLVDLGLLEAMHRHIQRQPRWSDVLVERLRSGRGSAISGQRRGRGLEDHAEGIIRRVFGSAYAARCQFIGKRNQSAKCDFAIPSRENPRILVEAKGYGATGSKMSDVVGDINAIIEAKRPDTLLLLFTDGLTWRQRQSDLRKLLERQHEGEITRIYTTRMSEQFEADLRTLKSEQGLYDGQLNFDLD